MSARAAVDVKGSRAIWESKSWAPIDSKSWGFSSKDTHQQGPPQFKEAATEIIGFFQMISILEMSYGAVNVFRKDPCHLNLPELLTSALMPAPQESWLLLLQGRCGAELQARLNS